jgi:DNA-binding MarR family transcriptional regulator
MTVDSVVQIVQVSFPQVYLACHTRHQRKRSTAHRLSTRDSAILAHLDLSAPILPSRLASHLNVTRSTVSEAVKRLTTLGYVRRANSRDDGRSSAVILTAKGAEAIQDTSVLETYRLKAALKHATPAQRRAIGRGIAQLAAACRTLSDPAGRP